MARYKVKKGIPNYQKTPIEEWSTDQMCIYYKVKFKEKYKIDTRRPIGRIKCHINKKFIAKLFQLEGRTLNIHPNQLFKDFIDWNINRKTPKNMRIWYLSKEDIMVDFLDERAKELIDKELGKYEDFEEEQKRKEKEMEEYLKKQEKKYR